MPVRCGVVLPGKNISAQKDLLHRHILNISAEIKLSSILVLLRFFGPGTKKNVALYQILILSSMQIHFVFNIHSVRLQCLLMLSSMFTVLCNLEKVEFFDL